MKKVVTLGLLTVAVFLLNCPGGVEDYYPTTIGSVWNYKMFVLMASPTDGTLDTIQTETRATVATRNDKLTSGEDVVEIVSTNLVTLRFPRESTFTIVETCYVRETGDMVLSYATKDDTEPDTTLVLPLSRGKTWNVGHGITAEVIEQEDVTVAAGTYKNTWKIKQRESGATEEIFIWLANRVGTVKIHSEWSSGGYNFTLHGELTSASIK